MKVCSRCKIEKPFTEFSPRGDRPPGQYRPRCRQCCRAEAKIILEKAKSPEELAVLALRRVKVAEGKATGGCRLSRYRKRQRARELINTPITKHCRDCGTEKGAEHFSPNKGCKDGLNTFCKNCMSRRRRESRKADPEKSREQGRRTARATRPACAERNRRYEAQKLQAEPKWSDRKGMRAIYEQAAQLTKTTGLGHHVDHIVPLNSPTVCGLHCLSNLQILPGHENIAKSNRLWPDMP